VILVTRQDPDLLAEGDDLLEARADLVELRPERLLAGIRIPLHAVARDAERARGAEYFLGTVRGVHLIDVGSHQRDRHAALLESLDELREIFLDARGFDVPAFADRSLDALEAESRDRLGELVVRQSDEMLREEAEFRGFRRRSGRKQRAEHGARHQRTGETQHRAAGKHRLTS
jgi:hypothetical protein